MSLEKIFGLELRRERNIKKLSQEELAFRVGIHRTYVSQLERGVKSPSLSILFKICAALEINPSKLVSRIHQKTIKELEH